MSNETLKETQTSSVTQVQDHFQHVNTHSEWRLPTWGVLLVLILAFFVLKSFIYIKDKKRHGK